MKTNKEKILEFIITYIKLILANAIICFFMDRKLIDFIIISIILFIFLPIIHELNN
jgi:hypothetical protein